MEIFQLIGIATITAITALILKSTKPELAFAVTVVGGIVMLMFAFDLIQNSVSIFMKIAHTTGISVSLVKIILKMIGIGYLVEFSSGILNDFGQNSLADKLTFCGKIIIFVLSVPILESILSLVGQLLGLIS